MVNGDSSCDRPTQMPPAANGGTPNQRNAKYRTKLCRNFPLGTCRYGEYCSYLHISPAPSPVSPYPSSYPNLTSVAQSILQPCNNFLFNDILRCEPPPPLWPAESPVDARSRGTSRTDGPKRRFTDIPPQASHVQKWRLSVDTVRDVSRSRPPAPPTTPTSASTSIPSSWAEHDERGWTQGDRPQPPQSPSAYHSDTPRPGRAANGANSYRAQKRNQFFRTKPCRFFNEPTGCVKGDRCNFIHASPSEGRLPTGLVAEAPAEVMSEGEAESAADSRSVHSEHSPSTAATSEAPSCASAAASDESQKRNFYPVTWRVVGGGVTLGGKREICVNYMAGRCSEGADCRFAHPDTGEDDCVFGTYPEPPPVTLIPTISPVLVPYPVMYPTMSPVSTFALPALPGPVPVTPPPTMQPTPTPQKSMHKSKNSLTQLTVVTTIAQPLAMSHAYSPHRVVDGSTLLDREPPAGSYRAENLWAGRSIVRPLSSPSTPAHGPDVGVAKLFAAEMP
ncbi:hypothetical protein OH77DRAFT_366946 [Trametes cingulata]|nr:hypothetical protein OH77DRAFT_366946 [Trametes cingulata]